MKLPKVWRWAQKSDMLRIKAGALAAGTSAPIMLTGPIFGFNIFIFKNSEQKPYEKNIEKRAEEALSQIVREEYQQEIWGKRTTND